MTEKSILIYEDDSEIREICRYWLERLGWIVHTKGTASSILSDVSILQPLIVLIDYQLPDITGEAAVQEFRSEQAFNNIPIIIFTARFDAAAISERAGSDGFLEKPFELKDLEPLLLQAIALKRQ